MTEGQPYLRAFSNDGIAWDWTKPCYHDTLHYQCDIKVDINDEDDGSKEENCMYHVKMNFFYSMGFITTLL